ncbi:MAG: 50S ribosomal protein L10 [Candidatus Harrisonbacteria bacterium CG10_big_fil_rev_8_21_14_0_10_42_17]|uniref:Large ribosomal subunit protein uL10 n=1 Tax=Candidatus Harrisonbacteria bacterium CG10_big_fil_rev_8_21_14_0_10_42_17 TaxID=1974584 RepID=A0A2M6WGX6_9BACT|nr:MAG: 50S ribosomal protein L10 [Candidatus Harrisonbacteria bacterium CG10_big_fil_rev_8_21_14_0_10_42_17]
MLTKEQKTEYIEKGKTLLNENKNIVFVDFEGISISQITKLKKSLRAEGAAFRVIKKRLFGLSMKESGHEFDPTQFPNQAGLIVIPGELSEAAGIIYKFANELKKEKINFIILGAYNIEEKNFISAEEFMVIAKLPSLHELRGMVVGALTGPIRAFMYVLSERAKQVENINPQLATSNQ